MTCWRHRRTPAYTIVHSTQFFEFLGSIAQSGTVDDSIHLSPAWIQPIASDDVMAGMFKATLGKPVKCTVEIAGPERLRLSELVQHYLAEKIDARKVVSDVHARYYGAELQEDMLLPGGQRASRLDHLRAVDEPSAGKTYGLVACRARQIASSPSRRR